MSFGCARPDGQILLALNISFFKVGEIKIRKASKQLSHISEATASLQGNAVFFRTVELDNRAQLRLTRSADGTESARILSCVYNPLNGDWAPRRTHLACVVDDICPSDYSVPLLSYQLRSLSVNTRQDFFNMKNLPWKLSRLGFKKISKLVSYRRGDMLNGYPLKQDEQSEERLFLAGDSDRPKLFSGVFSFAKAWSFNLHRGFSQRSQSLLIDDLALASLHDFQLRGLLKARRLGSLNREVTRRRRLHQTGSRTLRSEEDELGLPLFFSVNQKIDGNSLAFKLSLNPKSNSGPQGLAVRSACNRLMTHAIDALADSFVSAYKLEGQSVYFDLANDLSKFIARADSLKKGVLDDAAVYLNLTPNFLASSITHSMPSTSR